jgi:membrane protease YdiL (CAAX protease family)
LSTRTQAWLLCLGFIAFLFLYDWLLKLGYHHTTFVRHLSTLEFGLTIAWVPVGIVTLLLSFASLPRNEWPKAFPVSAPNFFFHSALALGFSFFLSLAFLVVLFDIKQTEFRINHYVHGLTPMVVGAAVCEELFFRGLLFHQFRKSYSDRCALVIITIAFVIGHFRTLNHPLIAALGYLILGTVAGLLRKVSGSIVPPILTHITFNLVQGIK